MGDEAGLSSTSNRPEGNSPRSTGRSRIINSSGASTAGTVPIRCIFGIHGAAISAFHSYPDIPGIITVRIDQDCSTGAASTSAIGTGYRRANPSLFARASTIGLDRIVGRNHGMRMQNNDSPAISAIGTALIVLMASASTAAEKNSRGYHSWRKECSWFSAVRNVSEFLGVCLIAASAADATVSASASSGIFCISAATSIGGSTAACIYIQPVPRGNSFTFVSAVPGATVESIVQDRISDRIVGSLPTLESAKARVDLCLQRQCSTCF